MRWKAWPDSGVHCNPMKTLYRLLTVSLGKNESGWFFSPFLLSYSECIHPLVVLLKDSPLVTPLVFLCHLFVIKFFSSLSWGLCSFPLLYLHLQMEQILTLTELAAQRSSIVHLIKLKHLKATAMNVCKINIIEFLQVCKQMTSYTDIPRLFIDIGKEKNMLT